MCLLLAVKMGGTVEENLSKTEGNRHLRSAFSHYSQVLTRVEGGIGGPNTPAGSPVNFSPNLSAKNSNFNTHAGFTITFA